MKLGRLLFAAAAVFAIGVLTDAANAVTITIGLQQDGGAISTVRTCNNVNCSFSDDLNTVSGTGSPPNPLSNLLGTTSLNVTNGTYGTLTVYVTASNITAPLGNLTFTSAFTSTLLPDGWSVTEQTLLSSTNDIFAGSTLLSSHTFTSIGGFTDATNANPGAGAYSVTAIYTIETNGVEGTGLSTIAISAVPVPALGAGLPGLIFASAGLLALARRRRQLAV
jgi:hypothetical protein